MRGKQIIILSPPLKKNTQCTVFGAFHTASIENVCLKERKQTLDSTATSILPAWKAKPCQRRALECERNPLTTSQFPARGRKKKGKKRRGGLSVCQGEAQRGPGPSGWLRRERESRLPGFTQPPCPSQKEPGDGGRESRSPPACLAALPPLIPVLNSASTHTT